jgi:hypothetical protein
MEVLFKLTESQGMATSVANLIVESLQLGSDIPTLACRNLNGEGLIV